MTAEQRKQLLVRVLRNAVNPFASPLAQGLEHAHHWRSRKQVYQAVGVMRLGIGTLVCLSALMLGWILASVALVVFLVYAGIGLFNIKAPVHG